MVNCPRVRQEKPTLTIWSLSSHRCRIKSKHNSLVAGCSIKKKTSTIVNSNTPMIHSPGSCEMFVVEFTPAQRQHYYTLHRSKLKEDGQQPTGTTVDKKKKYKVKGLCWCIRGTWCCATLCIGLGTADKVFSCHAPGGASADHAVYCMQQVHAIMPDGASRG